MKTAQTGLVTHIRIEKPCLKFVSNLAIRHLWQKIILICFVLLQAYAAQSQCKQSYSWAAWQNSTGNQATGTISVDNKPVSVTMTANYTFFSTNEIYRLDRLSGFSDYTNIPNSTTPATEWFSGAGGRTTFCFSEPVTNPILLYTSLGRANPNDYQKVALRFSEPYTVLYDAGGTTFIDAYSLNGFEGNAILLFPGTFSCITIYSEGTEYNTNLNWGLQALQVPVSIAEAKGCGKVTLTAQGGTTYQWSGGDNPSQAVNTVRTSGVYSVTATDQYGCPSIALKNVTVTPEATPTIKPDEMICLESAAVTLRSGATDDTLDYLWKPTNTTDSILVVTQPGNYSVTVTSSAGCQASRRIDVRAAGFCGATIFAPDGFTPNSDQMNDRFKVIVVDGLPIRLTIYDRWGAVIYSEQTSTPGWDGTCQGATCLPGVYSYVLTYKSTNSDEVHAYRSKLTLVR